mgnify:CR=1 FL=1
MRNLKNNKMAKKAFLVTFEITTRVVVDIDDNCTDTNPETNDELWQDIVDKACGLAYEEAPDWGENVSKIEEDMEQPYDSEYDFDN